MVITVTVNCKYCLHPVIVAFSERSRKDYKKRECGKCGTVYYVKVPEVKDIIKGRDIIT